MIFQNPILNEIFGPTGHLRHNTQDDRYVPAWDKKRLEYFSLIHKQWIKISDIVWRGDGFQIKFTLIEKEEMWAATVFIPRMYEAEMQLRFVDQEEDTSTGEIQDE